MKIERTPKTFEQLFQCCGSKRWAESVLREFPFANSNELMTRSQQIWSTLDESDFLEAFQHHPQIGDLDSLKKKFASTASLASNEQKNVSQASESVLIELAEWNQKYLKKFGFIFIICATGKSADSMLKQLKTRYLNMREVEIENAAHEQGLITEIRLSQWLETLATASGTNT